MSLVKLAVQEMTPLTCGRSAAERIVPSTLTSTQKTTVKILVFTFKIFTFEEYHVECGDGAAVRPAFGYRSTVYSTLTLGVHVGVNGCLCRAAARAIVSIAIGLYNSG